MNEVINKKTKQKGLIIGGILLLVVLLLGMIIFTLVSVKPKKIFTTSIDKVYSYVKENNNTIETTSGKFTFTTDLHSKNTQEEKILDIVNNLILSIHYGVDIDNKKINMDLDSQYKNKELLKANLFVENENAYVFLNDLYSKYIQVPIEGFDEAFATMKNKDDYEIVLKHLKEALNKALKDDYFQKENTTLAIQGKNIKVTENKLILNEKNTKEIASILSVELNNDEFIKSVSKITTNSEEKIKERLNSLQDENKNLNSKNFTISIYTKGFQNEFMGIEFKDEHDAITILKEKKENYSYLLKTNNETYKGNVEIKTNKKDIYLKISLDTKEINGSITFDFINDETPNIPNIDTSNAVLIDSLKDTDSIEILNNLQKNEGVVEFIQSITSLYSANLNF